MSNLQGRDFLLFLLCLTGYLMTEMYWQGPKSTFFGRRQLAAEIDLFSVAKWKNVVAKKCR